MGCGKALLQRTGNGCDEIIAQLCLPDAVAVVEADEEYVGCAVLVDEDMRVYALLVADEALHLVGTNLFERPFWGTGCGSEEVLVGGKVHDVLVADVIDFGCPEPLCLGGVGFVQGKSLVFPGPQIIRSVATDAVSIMGAVGVVGIAVQQNIRVG